MANLCNVAYPLLAYILFRRCRLHIGMDVRYAADATQETLCVNMNTHTRHRRPSDGNSFGGSLFLFLSRCVLVGVRDKGK